MMNSQGEVKRCQVDDLTHLDECHHDTVMVAVIWAYSGKNGLLRLIASGLELVI